MSKCLERYMALYSYLLCSGLSPFTNQPIVLLVQLTSQSPGMIWPNDPIPVTQCWLVVSNSCYHVALFPANSWFSINSAGSPDSQALKTMSVVVFGGLIPGALISATCETIGATVTGQSCLMFGQTAGGFKDVNKFRREKRVLWKLLFRINSMFKNTRITWRITDLFYWRETIKVEICVAKQQGIWSHWIQTIGKTWQNLILDILTNTWGNIIPKK